VKFSVRPAILLNNRECSPLRMNEGVNIPPRGQMSPLWARGEVKNGLLPGGVAQSTMHSPQEQKSRVRIPPGYKIFWKLCRNAIVNNHRLNMHCLCDEKEKYRHWPRNT
jgi:hypothetical protein